MKKYISALAALALLFACTPEENNPAGNGGGSGSAPDQNWGRDKNEDDILWPRRCFRKSRELVTTPVRTRITKRKQVV